jgi:hypothetical protein
MTRCVILLAPLLAAVPAVGQPPAPPGQNDAALRVTRAAGAEYAFRVGADDKPLDFRREPVLAWSNPVAGDVHGNAFVWTRGGRPLVFGCLFNWFAPQAPTVMEHEFHSLADGPVAGTFHGEPVWKTAEAGLKFADVPGAPAPAAGEAARTLQLKQLAAAFAGTGRFGKSTTDLDLRLLPQPLYRYAAPDQGVVAGGVFAFVRATDPEIVLLIEARGKDAAAARWEFAAVRMHSMADLRLRHKDVPVWATEPIPFKDVFERHERAYTAFRFKTVPDFLKDAAADPKPKEQP